MTEEEWNAMNLIPDNSTGKPLWETIIVTGDPNILATLEWDKPSETNKESVVDSPKHYGGKDNPYEAIKVIEAWDLGFNLGNVVKYVARAGKKEGNDIADELKKARWYLEREINKFS